MEILELELKNFRSYKSAYLDLSEVTTASICGENGAGKSTILYAMTFAFWGEVPGANMIDIPTKGARDCFVRTDILADSKDESGERERYRIVRVVQVAQGKKSSASSKVTLARIKPSGTIIDCSCNSVVETNKRIVELLGGMCYNTATHSNFALQGEADKFMQATPAERRQLFESILNLDDYDRLKDKARQRARDATAALKTLDIDNISEQQMLTELSLLMEKKTALSEACQELNEVIETLSNSIIEKEKTIGDGGQKIKEEIARLQRELGDGQTKIQAEEKNKKQAEDIIARKTEIETNRQQLVETRKSIEELTAAKNDYLALTSRKSILQNELQNAEKTIALSEKTIQILQQKRTAFDANIRAKFSIIEENTESGLAKHREATNEKLQGAKANLANHERCRADQTAVIKDLIQAEATVVGEICGLQSQIKKINTAGALCPVFNNECSRLHQDSKATQIKGLLDATSTLDEKKQQITRQKMAAESELKDISDKISKTQEEITLIQQQANEIDFVLESFGTTIREFESSCLEAEKQIVAKKQEVAVLEQDILEAENAINVLNFDLEKHDLEDAKYNALRKQDWEKQYQTLLVAEEAIRQINDKLLLLQEHQDGTLLSLKQQEEELRHKQEEIAAIEPILARQKPLLATKKQERQNNTAEMHAVIAQIGTAESNLSMARKRKNSAEQKRKELKTYEALAHAYDTVKTLITDNAIPKFQDAANNVLEYLGINVRIEVNTIEERIDKTTKMLKTSKIFEILVIDGEGDKRDYATWSGGEKHRINIALRQALSMTLLNRAGAKINLIVIDEGDSKLDAPGKAALVQMIEAANIGAIGGYPAKVLFITHSEDLKDCFERKIVVSQGKNGSVLRID